MADTNYIGAIIKILESPNNRVIKGNISITTFRAQLPQVRQAHVVNIVVWGNLANDVARYYNTSDYLLIEGYLSLIKITSLNRNQKIVKRAQLTVCKAYPFLLEINRSNR